MKIIVGLGNPGEKYARTRHNAGFMAVDALAKKLGLAWNDNKKFKSEIAVGSPSPLEGEGRGEVMLVKPQTYMNNSGEAVQAILSYYKLLPKKSFFPSLRRREAEGGQSNLSDLLTVIHDDIYIELGKYKTSIDSRSAGHNGVESIINHLKTKNFKRLRIGVKTEFTEKMPAEKFVLDRFNSEELKIIESLISEMTSNL